VRFLRDDSLGKFQSREIGENRTSCRSLIITQLYPINRNFTGSRCNIIAKLKAMPHCCCHPAKLHEGVQYDSPAPASTSALSAGQTPCHASGGSLSRPHTPHRCTRQQQQLACRRRLQREQRQVDVGVAIIG